MNGQTSARPFGGDTLGSGQPCLFSVVPGNNKKGALLHATCAVDAVRRRLEDSFAEQRTPDVNELWMLCQVLEGAQALLEACE